MDKIKEGIIIDGVTHAFIADLEGDDNECSRCSLSGWCTDNIRMCLVFDKPIGFRFERVEEGKIMAKNMTVKESRIKEINSLVQVARSMELNEEYPITSQEIAESNVSSSFECGVVCGALWQKGKRKKRNKTA